MKVHPMTTQAATHPTETIALTANPEIAVCAACGVTNLCNRVVRATDGLPAGYHCINAVRCAERATPRG